MKHFRKLHYLSIWEQEEFCGRDLSNLRIK